MAASYNIRFRGGVRSLFLISIGSMLPGSKYTCIVPFYISPHTVYLIQVHNKLHIVSCDPNVEVEGRVLENKQ